MKEQRRARRAERRCPPTAVCALRSAPAGVEPSHAHTADDLNYQRGYEWKMMVEARKRNPNILLSALAWAWPAWVGAGTQSPWTNTSLSTAYIVSWLKGARDVYNVTLDYVDADWNERGW